MENIDIYSRIDTRKEAQRNKEVIMSEEIKQGAELDQVLALIQDGDIRIAVINLYYNALSFGVQYMAGAWRDSLVIKGK